MNSINFTANVTFEEDRKYWNETHIFSTCSEYPTIESVLNEGVVQGDLVVLSRQSKWGNPVNAKFEARV